MENEAPPLFEQNKTMAYVIFITSAVGIVCNCMVMWVWSSESRKIYVPSTYLFKALAVSDNIYLFFCAWYYIYWHLYDEKQKDYYVDLFVRLMAFGIRRMGVLISLILAVIRIIKLFFPERARRLLSRFRMKMAVVFSLVFCLAMDTRYTTRYLVLDGDTRYELRYVDQFDAKVIGYMLPASLQIVLVLVVVGKIWHTRSKIATMTVNESSGRQSLSSVPPSEKFKPQPAPKRVSYRHPKTNHFVYVVFAICFMTFVAHVAGKAVRLLSRTEANLAKQRNITSFSDALLSNINSCANIFFYLYIPKFRRILLEKLCNMSRRLIIFTLWETSQMEDDHIRQTNRLIEGEWKTRTPTLRARSLSTPSERNRGKSSSTLTY